MSLWRWFTRAFEPPATTWAGPGVSEDAEAFLAGRLLERAKLVGELWTIPGWYWVNAIAHADVARLAGLAAEQPELLDRPGVRLNYPAARALLARDLLDLTGGDPCRVDEVQRRSLIALELELARTADVTPRRMLDLGRAELGQFRG